MSPVLATETFTALGTTAVVICERDLLAAATRLVTAELQRFDQACSRFRTDSELSRLNDRDGLPTRVSPLLFEAIAESIRAAEVTDGLVDPTIARALRDWGYDTTFTSVPPTGDAITVNLRAVAGWETVLLDSVERIVQLPVGVELDLGATAKGLAADHCAELVHRQLGCGVLIGLGGDIAVAGRAPDEGWSVLCTDDHAVDLEGELPASSQTVDIISGGLATSSITVRRWVRGEAKLHHLIDPVIGAPAHTCWRTASVAASTCVDANIASTAAMIMGEKALRWLEMLGLPARLVHADGRVFTTAGWPSADDAEADDIDDIDGTDAGGAIA